MSDEPESPAPIEMELEDVLDLHTFAPREVKDLVRHYLDLAVEAGFAQVRIVHGKGKGVQRELVRSLLERDPRIESYGDAPGESGGWGATWARFHSPSEGSESP